MQIQEAFSLIKDDIKLVEEEFKRNLSSDVYLIKKVGEYILTSGGKRFRPLILLLASRLCNNKKSSHIPLAVVVEFIHTATLLHDDVVDNAILRRGNTSANELWGNGASVLVGDYLLSKSFHLAVGQGNIDILETLSRTTTRMAEGEVLQLIKHSDINTTEQEYLDVITFKTAVLFSAACKIPAILAESSDEQSSSLSTFGMELGIAFQLMDDCLDYTSRDEELGKSVGNDLKEGKVTLPLIKTYKEATEAEKKIIKDTVEADELSPEKLKEIQDLIGKYEGIEYTTSFAKERIKNAKAALEVFPPSTERASLEAVAEYVIERNN
ncbi:Octaprenyl diphosphate synthase [hydrothermal vent metagenome]|uniref:Octaprenyl diphosphate synthase n=1 Tax=hydrothermal vent metagenome TaxID=652676 RepID=A0A3B0QQF5_9ZZZZ